MPIMDQVRAATHKTKRLAMVCGAVLGGFVPIASYVLVHQEVQHTPALWVLVTGGLIYSAKTVFDWTKVAFKHPAKAFGFVVLIEGVLAFSETPWLSGAALALLVAVNGISAGCQLALDAKGRSN